jgi:predicted enzyme related to lactoylglutathione lyase
MRADGEIDFVEFPGQNLGHMREFYGAAFGWTFRPRGADYLAFEGEGANGGFSADPLKAPAEPLVVFYARDLEAVRERVIAAGGEITRDIFAVPGGRRFHFRDPGENEAAVWSDNAPPRPCVRAKAQAQARVSRTEFWRAYVPRLPSLRLAA